MEKPSYFPFRHDIFSHPATAWMHPEDLAVFGLCASASMLGVCTYSERKIAKLTKVEADRVPLVLHALQENGNARWWPDDEIVWVVERADESAVAGDAWLSAQRDWRKLPVHVQDAIADRYPVLRTDIPKPTRKRTPGTPPRSIPPVPTPGTTPPSPPPGGTPAITVTVTPHTVPVTDADLAIAEARIREALLMTKPAGCPVMLFPHDRALKLLRAGATADEVIATLGALRDAVEDGREPKDHWNAQYFFSGHYDRLRNLGASAKRDLEL